MLTFDKIRREYAKEREVKDLSHYCEALMTNSEEELKEAIIDMWDFVIFTHKEEHDISAWNFYKVLNKYNKTLPKVSNNVAYDPAISLIEETEKCLPYLVEFSTLLIAYLTLCASWDITLEDLIK